MIPQSVAISAIGSRIIYGLCLRYTRGWFGVPAKYPTAASAWSHAAYRHPGEYPPAGAVVPVWFKYTNPAGHVAMHLADGTVVTVNGTRVSHFPSIAAMTRAGFGAYLGWAEDLNGVRVYIPSAAPQSAPASTPLNIEGGTMRAVATPSGRRFVLGELTYQDMSTHWDHASHEAHIWNSDTAGEPQVIADATLDLAIGQIQQRRAQLAEALKFHGV